MGEGGCGSACGGVGGGRECIEQADRGKNKFRLLLRDTCEGCEANKKDPEANDRRGRQLAPLKRWIAGRTTHSGHTHTQKDTTTIITTGRER